LQCWARVNELTEEEEFFAWLDGELQGDQAARVEARVAASPELTARAEDQRRLTAELRDSFDPILKSGSVPPHFEAAEVIDFGARAAGRKAHRPVFGVPQWAAMAATLALGLLVGNLLGRGDGDTLAAVEDGKLVAAGSLGHSLDSALASAPGDSRVRIGLTFRSVAGNVCRSFQDGSASGLACRQGQQWRIEGLYQGSEGQASNYRMAAGQDPRMAELIDQTIAGEPFDAAQERASREIGWR
jgi:hypothetical protein